MSIAGPAGCSFDCPYCSKGWQHFRMGYSISGGYVNCWACGKHSLAGTLMEASGLPFAKIKTLIEDLDRPRGGPEIRTLGVLETPVGVEDLGPAHRQYLRSRGFDADSIARTWGVRGIGISIPKFSWRLFIPIVHRGEVVSWTTRSISDRPDGRYRSAAANQEKIAHKSILYGADLTTHAAIIHEGPIDVWRTGPGAVATMGTSYSQAQALAISRYSLRVICFDNEPTAQRRARALCDALRIFGGRTINVRLEAKDAAEASEEEIRDLRRLIGG